MPVLHVSRCVVTTIQAVVLLAMQEPETWLQSNTIHHDLGIPTRYLEPVLQTLVRIGILDSARGPMGGFRLGVPAAKLTVRRVAEAVASVEAPIDLIGPLGDSKLAEQVLRPYFLDLIDRWNDDLAETTIYHLAETARKAKVQLGEEE